MLITKSDVAKALNRGDITHKDLQSILDGWRPARRGPKPDLMMQARVLAVFTMLVADGMSPGRAKAVLMAKRYLTKTASIDRYLDRARSNWHALPPFDPVLAGGRRSLAVQLFCRHAAHIGYHHTFEILPIDWRI